MRPRVPPVLAAAVLTAAGVFLGARADACNPGPKPGPSAPLASIDLDTETVTASSGDVSISPIDFGSEISLTIPNKAASRTYRLSIPLAADERLAVLAAGGAVIIQRNPIPPGDYPGLAPPADYQDPADADQSDEVEPTPDDGSGDFEGDNIEDDQDPSWYPEGDAVDSGVRDGWDITDDASDQASNELPDCNCVTISAFDPPLATDASGRSVPVALAKTSNGLVVSISPSSTAAFPIEIELAYGYNPDSYDPPTSASAVAGSLLGKRSAMARAPSSDTSVRASSACSDHRPEIVVSYVTGRKFLTEAFKKWPASCADYYISVPPDKNNLPRRGSAASVKTLNNKVKKKDLKKYRYWNTSGAKFTPLAEVNFGRIANPDYRKTGTEFAGRMSQRGYGVWSIDEFYGFMKGPASNNPTRWNNYADLVAGLSERGADGAVFNAVINHAPEQNGTIRTAKARWKMLLSETQNYDWRDLSTTKLWLDEDYTKCSVVCVPGASLTQKAANTNSYMQKLARLAFAPDAPTTAPTTVTPARTFLETRFAPMINGWGAVSPESYDTYDMSAGQIRRLASLQVYAARAWIQPRNPYADLRIGVRWTDKLDSNNGWGVLQRANLAMRIARAMRGAYSPSGKPIGACDPNGGSNSKACQATDSRATDFAQAKLWNVFKLWGNTSCQRPSNDDFANARTIAGSEGSVDGTTKCATWESGETSPNGAAKKSVWYRWDAPATNISKFAMAVDSNNDYLETNLYTGTSLGHLTWVPFTCGASPGGTYWIQVIDRLAWGEGDAPAGPFTLSWGTAGCDY